MSNHEITLGIFFLDALEYQKLTFDSSIPCHALKRALQEELEGMMTRAGPILAVFAAPSKLTLHPKDKDDDELDDDDDDEPEDDDDDEPDSKDLEQWRQELATMTSLQELTTAQTIGRQFDKLLSDVVHVVDVKVESDMLPELLVKTLIEGARTGPATCVYVAPPGLLAIPDDEPPDFNAWRESLTSSASTLKLIDMTQPIGDQCGHRSRNDIHVVVRTQEKNTIEYLRLDENRFYSVQTVPKGVRLATLTPRGFDPYDVLFYKPSSNIVSQYLDPDKRVDFSSLDRTSLERVYAQSLLTDLYPWGIPKSRLHFIVEIPGNVSPKILVDRFAVTQTARDNKLSPSTGARVESLIETQEEANIAAIYNSRPPALEPPPVSIYHPIFGRFTRLMAESHEHLDYTRGELDTAEQLVMSSLPFYHNKTERHEKIDPLKIIHDSILTVCSMAHGNVKPDGCVFFELRKFDSVEIPVVILGLNNEIGTGGSDPSARSECCYVKIHEIEEYVKVQQVSSCPAFLIGVAGPHLSVSGAVFAERFSVQRLTDYIFLGPVPTPNGRSPYDEGIQRIAQLLRTLKLCVEELCDYYAQLQPAPLLEGVQSTLGSRESSARGCVPTPIDSLISPIYPYFTKFNSKEVQYTLAYTRRLEREYSSKTVFQAELTSSQDPMQKHDVVVKFAYSYSGEGHQLLAEASFAPKLWYCERDNDMGLYVIVMEYVEVQEHNKKGCSSEQIALVAEAVQILHDNGLVFGDLRSPNILPTSTGVNLIDFEWCGKEGEARYPADINKDHSWHHGVERGGKIMKEHDKHMLKGLAGEEF